MKLVILLFVASACSGGSTAKPPVGPAGRAKAPGLLWETVAEPWHLTHNAGSVVAVAGDTAIFGGMAGWLMAFDLATGKQLRERQLPMGTITDVLHLGDNRFLAVGLSTGTTEPTTVAFTFDATLEPTEVKLPTRPKPVTYGIPHAAMLVDGVVISGRGLPLSIYDPKTWAVRSTLDTTLGWSQLAARGDILLAARIGLVKRINVATNGQRDLPRRNPTHLAVADGFDILRVSRPSKWIAELHPDTGAEPVSLDEDIEALAMDGTGTQLITAARQELRLHALPGGEIKKRIKIVDKKLPLGNFRVFGKRVVAAAAGIVRVIDLDTGKVTPERTPTPYAERLAVGTDGSVLVNADEDVWTVANGTATGLQPLPEGTGVQKLGSRSYTTTKKVDRATTIELHTLGDKAVKTWSFDDREVPDTYLGKDGSVVFEVATYDGARELLRSTGGATERLLTYNADAEVFDVDPAGDALLSIEGRVAVVGLADHKTRSTLRVPHCEGILDWGAIEVGGTRAVTYDDKELALWDRTTGKLIAAVEAKSPQEVMFVPGRPELLLTFDDRIVLWTPTKGARTLPYSGVSQPAISADGKKLALAFFDARIATYDLDALIAAAPLGADLPAGEPIPETCGEIDPAVPEAAPEEHDWESDE